MRAASATSPLPIDDPGPRASLALGLSLSTFARDVAEAADRARR